MRECYATNLSTAKHNTQTILQPTILLFHFFLYESYVVIVNNIRMWLEKSVHDIQVIWWCLINLPLISPGESKKIKSKMNIAYMNSFCIFCIHFNDLHNEYDNDTPFISIFTESNLCKICNNSFSSNLSSNMNACICRYISLEHSS